MERFTMAWRNCNIDETLELASTLNTIPSPTDEECILLAAIEIYARALDSQTKRLGRRNWAAEKQLLIGSEQAALTLVVHADRVSENPQRLLPDDKGVIRGKLDNTISLAAALVALKRSGKTNNVSILVTTAEETRKPKHGGRGFIDYLEEMSLHLKEDFANELAKHVYVAVDVRPLDKNDVLDESGLPIELGDGLVLRLEETKSKVSADEIISNHIRQVASKGNVVLFDFKGGGRTELGRSWISFLEPRKLDKSAYRIAWLQLPVRDCHKVVERTHIDDLRRLQWTLEELAKSQLSL